jgi:hypothetical protein
MTDEQEIQMTDEQVAHSRYVLTALNWARDFWRKEARENPAPENQESYQKAAKNVLFWKSYGKLPSAVEENNGE